MPFMAFRLLATSCLVALPAHAGEVIGDCFANAVPASQRTKLVNMHGDQRPVGIWRMEWPSGHLMTDIMDILATEKLGYQTRTDVGGSSSYYAFYALAGCENPRGLNDEELKCGSTTSDFHVALEAWGGAYEGMYSDFAKWNPAIAPNFHGGVGYYGRQTLWILDAQREAAWNAEALSLDWYRSYNTSWFVPWVYFENAAFFIDSNSDLFRHCADTQMGIPDQIEDFLRVTGDADGVEYDANGLLKAKCVHNDTWWLSPACRNNASRCIFTYSGGNGWFTISFMQKAVYYEMPLGIAVAKDWSTYVALCRQYASAFYWWEPDTTFIELAPHLVTFEPHDKMAWAAGDQRTASDSVTCHKFTWHDLSVAAPDVYTTVANLEVSLTQINDMLLNQTRTGLSSRTTACLWLRDNPETWQAWMPDPTECIPGQGLVNSTGGFVDIRADAVGCEWCAPGRRSLRVVDSRGPTYVCSECPTGTFQSTLGQEECSLCAPGTYNDEVGQSECSRCKVGKYQPSFNTTSCMDCVSPRTTMVLGAADILECVCPEHMYQPLVGGCMACGRGLECPINSMEVNIPPGPGQIAPACDDRDECKFPVPEPKFFTTYGDPLSVYECLDELACPGNAVEMCGGNMEGLACGTCEKGYYRSAQGTCDECTDIEMSRVIFPTMPLIIGPPAVVLYYMFSRDEVQRWGSPANQLACVGYTILVYLQTVNMLMTFKVDLPIELASSVEWSGFTNDVLGIFRPECATFSDFTIAFVGSILLPVYVLMLFVLTYSVSLFVSRFRPDLLMRRELLCNCYGGLLFTFYISIASQALSLFQCYTHPNGKKSLRSSPGVLCGEETWSSLLAVAIPAVLIFCVATLAVLAYVLYVAPSRFQDRTFRMRWKFALIKFRPSVWWWGLVVLVKGLLLTLTTAIWENGTAQLAWIQTAILVYTSLTYGKLPWRSFKISCLEAMQHCFLVFFIAFMPHFVVSETGEARDLIPIVICSVWTPLAVSAVIGFSSARTRYQEFMTHEVPCPLTVDELKETCKVFSRMGRVDDWHEMMKAIQTMSDTDVRILTRARDIVVSELAVDKRLKYCSGSGHLSHRTESVLAPTESPPPSPRSTSQRHWFPMLCTGASSAFPCASETSGSEAAPCRPPVGKAPQPDGAIVLPAQREPEGEDNVSEDLAPGMLDYVEAAEAFAPVAAPPDADLCIDVDEGEPNVEDSLPAERSSTFFQARPIMCSGGGASRRHATSSLSTWRASAAARAPALQT